MKESINLSRITYTSNVTDLEGLILLPEGASSVPGVVFIHGHNDFGAWETVWLGYALQKAGFATFMPSQMGYGPIRNLKDFCGPKTVKGVAAGVQEFLQEQRVIKDKIGIWGVSRGAIVASQIICQYPDLFQAAVLQAGVYDMNKDYNHPRKLKAIKEKVLRETGATEEVLRARSSIHAVQNITCPVLILHGEQDDRVNVEQAQLLDQELTRLRKVHETIIVPQQGHILPPKVRDEYTIPFLKKYLYAS